MKERILEKLQTLIPNAKGKDALLELLIERSMDDLMNECGTDEVPDRAENVLVQMVMFNYNQQGGEGLAAQSYSGQSESYLTDYPANLKRSMRRFRGLKTL